MISFRSRRGAFAIFAFVLLLLFLVRPGAGSLKARIARSVGRSLGKQVEIGAVSLRFLPPGFELANLVVHDDPEFGNEPIMRAPEVTASIRLLSLLRGRLDVARLELSNPSLNLVRSSTGVWNLSKLLERSAETVVAPTGKSRRESRPAFPYIQAEHARINLKSGQEKRPLAFTEAEFALWQDSEDSWGVRLKAQPMRTDSSLTDTGT
ncbi:MAG: AsmA family protein, partial [Acidobacteriales bacterium]|nr:AsmA family protein [Terriglobales bacterium]